MRSILSSQIANLAKNDPNFLLLTGDHGYALFDELRKEAPDKFVNVGIMEQALIGMAAGLSKLNFKVMCYGLSAFVPIRVLEQIKFDVCLPQLPIKIIGDGAGLVYTHLGNSHLCAEDMSVLSPLPGIEIYSPGDQEEMRICFQDFHSSDKPSYLRVGKSDTPNVNKSALKSIEPYFTHQGGNKKNVFISTGAMLGCVNNFARNFDISHISVMKVKPISHAIIDLLKDYERIFVFEEHVRIGGLRSAITDLFLDQDVPLPRVHSFSLNDSFIHKAGKYQFAMSQHGISVDQMERALEDIL